MRKPAVLISIFLISFLNLGMAKLAPRYYAEGTGPRYFLVLLKNEADIYKKSFLTYPESLENLEESMRKRYGGSINFFYKTKGIIHNYEIIESSPNFFRARSFNERGFPNYEITSSDSFPVLIEEKSLPKN